MPVRTRQRCLTDDLGLKIHDYCDEHEPSLPPAAENAVRAHAHQLRAIAAAHGISELRFASLGRLVGHLAEDKDALDVADFELAAIQLLGADVRLYSDRVLRKLYVSFDLVTAQPV